MLPLRDMNPTRRRAVVTFAFILANVGLFVLVQQRQPAVEPIPVDVVDEQGNEIDSIDLDGELAFDLEHAAIPCEVVRGEPLTQDEL
ncbi:MAG TPA: hypothetical protein VD926_11220, partial [Acidimicrobiales bacterium]|nr:hypothetical protein [Acidimicrobiales bacterium]